MVNCANKTVVLIAFYNIKALGIRYLKAALEAHGYHVVTVFYKNFNSIHPQMTTITELNLLCEQIRRYQPVFIGISVMSSMYLDTVHLVVDKIKENFNIPLVCGGAYATMFPQHFLERGVEFVIRTDGEITICQLADALYKNTGYKQIPSLCYLDNGEIKLNDIGNICSNIDEYGIPVINSQSACYIENNVLKIGDPQLNTLSYEVIASRGCPFTCSYCCCEKLRRLFPKGVKYVRTRSVKSVIDELILAKKTLKKLVFVHFYDEIFPNLPGWVDEFIVEYKKHINLPFTIWSHPKMVDPKVLKKLVSAGLCEVIMGIQSGSEHIRRDVFHRYETQEDIIEATRYIRESGVFRICYDFMLQHPFETLDDLKETYNLVKLLYTPFELQLHGLNFLPGTEIVKMAIDQGYVSVNEMNRIMYAPMEEQFKAYWKRENNVEGQLWYQLTFCLQFNNMRKKIETYAADPLRSQKHIIRYYMIGMILFRLRYFYKKMHVVIRSKLCRLGII